MGCQSIGCGQERGYPSFHELVDAVVPVDSPANLAESWENNDVPVNFRQAPVNTVEERSFSHIAFIW
jgi:hypothetical protein